MKHSFFSEIVISIILLALLLFFVNPMDITMPEQMHMFMGPTLILVFLVLVGVLIKENGGDEREQLHKYIASRFTYFAGVGVVLLGIIIQSSHKVLDSWLVITLAVMLLAKVLGLLYGNFKR